MWATHETHGRITRGVGNSSRFLKCSENVMMRRFDFTNEDQSVAGFRQENTSNYNKYSPKQTELDESEMHSYLLAKRLRLYKTLQKSSLTSKENLIGCSSKKAELGDENLSKSEITLKRVERQGVPEHLIPANAMSNIDVVEVSGTDALSPFTRSIDGTVNIHLAKEFAKLSCVSRRRLQRRISSSKHDAKSLLAKRKQDHCAKEECPEFQDRDLGISSQAEERLKLERNKLREILKSRNRNRNCDINRTTDVPPWKTYLDNMKIPRSPKRETLFESWWLDGLDETKMEFAEERPAVKQYRVECDQRGIDYTSPTVGEGDETGYESEVQTPENELSFFGETVNRQASLKSNLIHPPGMNSSKSFQTIWNSNTTDPLPIEDNIEDLENELMEMLCGSHEKKSAVNPFNPHTSGSQMNSSKSFQIIGNSITTDPLLIEDKDYFYGYSENELQEMLYCSHEKKSAVNPFNPHISGSHSVIGFSPNHSRASAKHKYLKLLKERELSGKVPDYSKPGCSKDADYMGDFSMYDTRPIGRNEKRSFMDANFESDSPVRPTYATGINKSFLR